jgi:4-hydroxybenzoate polyprenyltransferase
MISITWGNLVRRLDAYERLIRLDKPIGTLLLLWPTLWALWMASEGRPSWHVVWIFALGTLLMRSAGCAINDWADREFDAHVQRTAQRPLATREIAGWEALMLAAVLAVFAFALIIPLNRLTLWLSIPALFIAGSYPFTKRFFALPQAYLGVAFGFGIPMAYAAVRATVPAEAWWLLGANIFWAIAYDTEYAMVDRDDDLRIGIKTSAITFGRFDVAAVMLCYVAFLGILAWLGVQRHAGELYYAGLVVAAGLMAYHYRLIRGRNRLSCFHAFRNNNWVGCAIFVGMACDYALRLRAWPNHL